MSLLKMMVLLSANDFKQILLSLWPFHSPSTHTYLANKSFWDVFKRSYTVPSGIPGSGAGKGGGGGGSVRQSGGGLGQYGAAQEEGYFYKKQRELLKNIKKKLKEEDPETARKKGQ